MTEKNSHNASRRLFVTALSASGVGLALLERAQAAVAGPLNGQMRRSRAHELRRQAADAAHGADTGADQVTNGDEEALSNQIGSFTKALEHNADGEVNPAGYRAFLAALNSSDPAAYEDIPLGGTVKLTNPQGGLAYDLQGGDALSFSVPPPPRFASREEAAEIAENYWMALLRDVPFSEYPSNRIAQAAAEDITSFGNDAKVPKDPSGRVTPAVLFRGLAPGDSVGPYLSQFFLLPCPFGMNNVQQLVRSPLPNVNFMTSYDVWLAVQNGVAQPQLEFESTPRYMRDGRALSEWVHVDVLFQAYFMAFLALSSMGAPADPGNPYAGSRTQVGFTTFGGPHVATLLCEVSTRALHATWYQKWYAHRRLRPEAFAGAAHVRLYRGGSAQRFPVHEDILSSLSSSARLGGFLPSGSALLPMAFPEGCPAHPAYTAGHATVAGACATILKAFFDESWVIPRPVQPSTDGLSLLPYSGELTVGGELDKVASNVALGRSIAGVHWRSDATASLQLGEAVAIQLLQDQRATYHESQQGMSITKFDGTRITI